MSAAIAALAWAGLDTLTAAWRERHLPFDIAVSESQIILGRDGQAGSQRPLRSSVAELRVGAARVWIPAPLKLGDGKAGDAPVFLLGDAKCVLPTIRLFSEGKEPSYLTYSDWVRAALEDWKLPCLKHATSKENDKAACSTVKKSARRRAQTARASAPECPEARVDNTAEATTASVLDRIAEKRGKLDEATTAAIIAEVLRFSLLGFKSRHVYRLFIRTLGLRFPRMKPWLRKVAGVTSLAQIVAQRMVLTGRLEDGLPRTSRRAAHRIRPDSSDDWGIDPVHTSEDKEKIRFVGYLGDGVTIMKRRLDAPEGRHLHLSPSTVQIPFARFDAPRRLLLAAKMQAQAIPVIETGERPVVRLDHSSPYPPGVNLRVAYMAWQGLNHEDAWVLSHSAAKRLACQDTMIQSIDITSVESPPSIKVRKDETVRRGEILLHRRVSPSLLAPEMDDLIELCHSQDLFGEIELPRDETVKAATGGVVCKIEIWDLATGEGIPEGVRVPADTASRFRYVVRFHIRQDLSLKVGDKLANRHGHKGIVGAIVPDQAMPRWRGKPLDALIDPVSVLNRSSWGQIYETLGGCIFAGSAVPEVQFDHAWDREKLLDATRACGCDEIGRSEIEPPEENDSWMDSTVRAIAGVQWVMRLPKHAGNIISADHPKGSHSPRVRQRRMRLGEQGTWASWAHGLGLHSGSDVRLSAGAQNLACILAAAGIEMTLNSEKKVLQLLLADLSTAPSHFSRGAVPRLSLSAERDEVIQRIARGEADRLTCLTFGRPITDVYFPQWIGGKRDKVACVMIPPARVRPPQTGLDGREQHHELTQRLLEVAKRAIDWKKKKPFRSLAKPDKPEEGSEIVRARLLQKLRRAIRDLATAAYGQALGTSHDGYKDACIGRELLCPRVEQSGRAVASPAGWVKGGMELDLDEVGLPVAVACAVLGKGEIRNDDDLLKAFDNNRPWVWIKRDPVLHRWGLLRVKVHVVLGNTIQLPASLLRPLGADFDGDTVMVFGALPGKEVSPVGLPSKMAWDGVLKNTVFYPSKQYVYGIHLLQRQEEALRRLNQDLQQQNAPAWPKERKAKTALEEWAGAAARSPDVSGSWWATVERHALTTLAADPGMGLGLCDQGVLSDLEAVSCGAAKEEVFAKLGPGSELFDAYRGESLAVYARNVGPDEGQATAPDMIHTVMVSAAAATGHFGNVPRRFIYSAKKLDDSFVRDVHALSERANQQVLSVKASKGGLNYNDFEKYVLKPLSQGNQLNFDAMPESIRNFLDTKLREACDRIRVNVYSPVPGWLKWLQKPSDLGTILVQENGCIELPLDDPRVKAFLSDGPGFEDAAPAARKG